MTTLDWFSIAAILVCLLLSFVFAGSETALMAFSRAACCGWREGQSQRRHRQRLFEARERLIGALLLGNNAVNILASSLATSVFWSGSATSASFTRRSP